MKFSLFYEMQISQPTRQKERECFRACVEQVALADRLGYWGVWEVEHHGLYEYSHSSAPEIFLSYVAALTQRLRLGHGITLTPACYNHPLRIAERIATLDILSQGRVNWGSGKSSSLVEQMAFGADIPTLHESGFPGFDTTQWTGLLAPRGTSAEIVNRLAAETRKALALDDVRQRFAQASLLPVGNSPKEFDALIRRGRGEDLRVRRPWDPARHVGLVHEGAVALRRIAAALRLRRKHDRGILPSGHGGRDASVGAGRRREGRALARARSGDSGEEERGEDSVAAHGLDS